MANNIDDWENFPGLFGDFEVCMAVDEPAENVEEIELPLEIQQLLFADFNEVESQTVQNNESENDTPRFKVLSEDDLQAVKENRYSEKTQKNTKWGVALFQDWCTERYGQKVDLHAISKNELNSHLVKFYAEAAPKMTSARKKQFHNEAAGSEYHRTTMKNARAAINRYFRDQNININIVRDSEFQEANDMLESKIRLNLKMGLSRPTKHKPIIPSSHMRQIHSYLLQNTNPIKLRQRIWFILSIQYVTRGLEFHPQLNKNTLQISCDENGKEYVTLSHEVKEKQHQSGTEICKRMYAMGDNAENCPVEALKFFLSKCDPNAEKLFCQVNKVAIANQETAIWYNTKAVPSRQFTTYMSDICRSAGLTERYTAHSLRATASQGLDDVGFELRHIMHMTGHMNEASIRSYSRGVKDDTQKKMSATLTNIIQGLQNPEESHAPVVPAAPLQPTRLQNNVLATIPATVQPSITQNGSATMPSHTVQPARTVESSTMTMSMMNPAGCTFNNCVFNMSGGYKLD